MAQFDFGAGFLFGTPKIDAYGNAITNPTPVQFGVLQEISVDIGFDTKMLYGQLQFPVAIGRGKGKISLKAKFAQINGSLLSSLLFGQTLVTGRFDIVSDTTGVAIPATPFTITVTPPASGTFVADLGVRDANGLPMRRVASAPITGQYTVSAGGAYVFAAADASKIVFISYRFSASGAAGETTQTIKNVPMGYSPSFAADLWFPFNGKSLVMTFPNAVSSKFSFGTKLDDFAVPEFDADVFADSSNNVAYIGTSEA